MDLRQLRYFVEIVEQGTMSRAAHRLGVAQPALSIHLRNMEAELGAQLLIRSRAGVKPTEAGEVLLRHARLMLAEQTRVEDEIRNLGRDPAGEVRVGLPVTISDVVTVPLIEAVRRRHPRIRLTVSDAMSGFVANWLSEDQVDMAILYTPPVEPGMTSLKLLDEQLVVVGAPRGLPSSTISLADVATMPMILPSRQHGLRRMLETEASAQGVSFRVEVEIDSYKNIKSLVARGFGVSVLPLHAVTPERQAGRLVIATLAPRLYRRAFLAHRSGRPVTSAVGAVLSLVPEVVNTLVTEGIWSGATLGDGADR